MNKEQTISRKAIEEQVKYMLAIYRGDKLTANKLGWTNQYNYCDGAICALDIFLTYLDTNYEEDEDNEDF